MLADESECRIECVLIFENGWIQFDGLCTATPPSPSPHSPRAAHLKCFPEAPRSLNSHSSVLLSGYFLGWYWSNLKGEPLSECVKSPANQWLTVAVSLIKVTLPISVRSGAAGQSSDEWGRGFVLPFRIPPHRREVELGGRLSITEALQLQERDRTRLEGETRGKYRSLSRKDRLCSCSVCVVSVNPYRSSLIEMGRIAVQFLCDKMQSEWVNHMSERVILGHLNAVIYTQRWEEDV